MKTDDLILVEQFCLHHNIDPTFIVSLHDFGMLDLIVVDERHYLSPEKLQTVEKIIRLHYELEINLEGIDAILHLLARVENLQQELIAAQNKLRSF